MPSTRNSLLTEGWQEFYSNNLPQAELFCREHISQNPTDYTAYKLLASIAFNYRFPTAFSLCEQPNASQDRYILIKAWGYGFWSEGHHLASQLLLAELTNRIPIILWGNNSLFSAKDGNNSIDLFFENLSQNTIDHIPQNASFYPPKWNHTNLHEENVFKWEGEYSRLAAQFLFHRSETVIVSDFFSTISSIIPWISPNSTYYGKSDDDLYELMFQKYLQPKQSIVQDVNAYYDHHMAGNIWVAVHVRGSDKVLESPNLQFTNTQYHSYIDTIIKLNPSIKIFLMTDTSYVVDEYVERYGDRVLCTPSTRTNSQEGIHLNNDDGVKIGKEVFIDSLLAIKCDYFIGNQESNVSLAISSMKKWPTGQIIMLGVASARRNNFYIHRREDTKATRCSLCETPFETDLKEASHKPYKAQYCKLCNSLHMFNNTIYEFQKDESSCSYSETMRNVLVLPRFFEIIDINQDDRSLDFHPDTPQFTELMRNIGYNFYSYTGIETHSGKNHIKTLERQSLKLVTLFNVIEKFQNPREMWKSIFNLNPSCVVGTTELIAKDQLQLSERTNNLCFYETRYTPETLSFIAMQYGYCAYILGDYFLLARSPLSEKQGHELTEWYNSLENVSTSTTINWTRNYRTAAQQDSAKESLRLRLREKNIRIALEGYFFRFSTGITRLWTSLLAEWSVNGFGEFITVLDRDNTAPRFGGISYRTIPQHDYSNLPADHAMLQSVCDEEEITLFTSTYYTSPLTTPAVIMIPDMIPEVMGFDLSNPQWTEKHNAIAYADSYFSISESTSRDLIKFFPNISPSQITTSYCGTDFRTASSEKVATFKDRHGISKPYFMISGVKTDYKNAILFFKAFEQLGDLRKDFAIVCTNSRPELEPEFAECLGEGTIHLLILSDEELQCAYSGAIALAFPSRYEGFGLPVLEAMACSCPVITCQTSSIPEVGGDAVIYVSPDSVDEMLDAMKRAQTAEIRAALIEQGLIQARKFSWRKMADTIEKTLAETATQVWESKYE